MLQVGRVSDIRIRVNSITEYMLFGKAGVDNTCIRTILGCSSVVGATGLDGF